MAVPLAYLGLIAAGPRLPEGGIEERLRLELPLALYGQGILSSGKAAELAGAIAFIVPRISPGAEFRGTTDRRSRPKI